MYGVPVTFTATITPASGTGPTITGTVTFTVDGMAGAPQPVSVGYGVSGISPVLSAGVHTVSAHYDGDSNYLPSSSSTVTVTVDKASPVVAITSNPAYLDQPVAIRAAVTLVNPSGQPAGTVTGTVDFAIGGAAIAACTGAPVSSGIATCNAAFSQPGVLSVTANYSGDANISPAAGSMQIVVAKAAPGVYVASDPVAPVYGVPVTLGVQVQGAPGVPAPTGTITFLDGGRPIGSVPVGPDGHASLVAPSSSLPVLSVGAHSIGAIYSGDANYQTAAPLALTIIVAKATTGVALSSTPAQIGQPVTLKAAISIVGPGIATLSGTVSFSSGGYPIQECTGIPLQNNIATCNTAFPHLGTYLIVASYSGDDNTTTSFANIQLNLGKVVAGLYTASAPDAPAYGATVTVNALLLGADGVAAPTGTITFSEGGAALATVPVGPDGRASVTMPSETLGPLSVGSHNIVAVYSGDANYQTATAQALKIVVSKASAVVAVASTPAQIEQPVTLKAAVTLAGSGSPAPGGTVDFTNGGNPIAGCARIPLQNGIATCATSFRQLGAYAIAANYSGDANTTSGTATMQLTVARAVVGLYTASTPAAPVYGTPVAVTALVMGAPGLPVPTGAVTFSEGGVARGSVPLGADGHVSLALPAGGAAPLSVGVHAFTAAYGGDANYASATSPAFNVIVGKASTSTVLTASYGGPFVATVIVSPPAAGVPTGTVQFLQAGTPIGSAPVLQTGTYATATLPAATQTGSISAVYSGDSNFTGSTADPATVAARTQVSISSDRNPAPAGQPVTFTVHVTAGSGTPGGSVQFSDGGATLGTAILVSGRATLSSTLDAGQHTIFASYSGDSTYPAGSATLLQVVSKSTTPLSLASSANTTVYGQPVTFTAQFGAGQGTVEGTVQFFDGGAAIGSAQASEGVATLSIANLPAGTHAISAAWAGDATTGAAVSAPVAVTVNKAQTSTSLMVAGLALNAVVAVGSPGAGSPTGTVRFVDAATNAVLATIALAAGSASMPVSTTDPVVAVYSGDNNFRPSVSAALTPLVAVNAASYLANAFAPDEIVTLFGSNLAADTASSTATPTASLVGTVVNVTDSAGSNHPANLLFVSPAQASFVMPADLAPGPAVVTISNDSRAALSVGVTAAAIAPGIFTMNGSGHGPPAGQIIRVHPDGTQEAPQGVAVLDKAQNQWVPSPVDLGASGDSVYLVLYGTGFRHYNAAPVCTIGGQQLAVAFAGAQGAPGLDQVNVLVPASLRGAGQVELSLSVDGTASNPVTLVFQ